MAFTVTEFRDLVRILRMEPEWREELRRLVLTDELMTLPEKLEQLDAKLTALAEAQQQGQKAFGEFQEETRQRFGEVSERFDQVDKRFEQVDKRFESIDDDLGRLKGDNLEVRYRERPFVYFSKIIRKARTLSLDTLQQLLEQAIEQGQLTQTEADDIALSDVIVQGISQATGAQVRLAVEVSWGIGLTDVERVARRATLLSQLGIPTIPVAAGTRIVPEAMAEAKRQQVWIITNGATLAPA